MRTFSGTGKARGHFGELIQGYSNEFQSLILVTLPCHLMDSTAHFQACWNSPLLVSGNWEKTLKATRVSLIKMQRKGWGGIMHIRCTAPVCGGAGSSTLCVLSALRAVHFCFGITVSAREETDLCRSIEQACDPLMFNNPERIIWSPLEAKCYEVMPPLPDFIAVGGFDGLGCLTDSCDRVSPPIDDILTTLKRGVLKQCSYTIGEATTASAELNQLYNPKPHWKDIITLAHDVGACGVCVAHTGSAVAMLFTEEQEVAVYNAQKGLESLGIQPVCFRTPRSR